jgi:hypothetical protein
MVNSFQVVRLVQHSDGTYTTENVAAKGTRSAIRRLKAMSGREAVHARRESLCHETTGKPSRRSNLRIRNLSGIRKNRRGKKMNKWLGSWSFYQQDLF